MPPIIKHLPEFVLRVSNWLSNFDPLNNYIGFWFCLFVTRLKVTMEIGLLATCQDWAQRKPEIWNLGRFRLVIQ